MPNNATSIRFAISKLIIFASDRKTIVLARAINEAAMPATIFSVLFLGIRLCGLSMTLIESTDLQEATLVSLSKLPSIVVITDSDPNGAWLSVPGAYGRSQLAIQEDEQGDDGHHQGYRGNE